MKTFFSVERNVHGIAYIREFGSVNGYKKAMLYQRDNEDDEVEWSKLIDGETGAVVSEYERGMKIEMKEGSIMSNKYEILGDITAPAQYKDVTHIYKDYTKHGVKEDEIICLNWRVVSKKTGRTMSIFGGLDGRTAAQVYKDYCEENYR